MFKSAPHLMTLFLLSFLLIGCKTPRPSDAIRESGDAFYQQGNYEAAAGEYRLITDRYPGDWRAQHMLGVTAAKTGQLAESRRALEIAHTARPNDDDIANALAETMFLQGDKNNLYAFLQDRARKTQSVPLYLTWARYAEQLGDHDSALTAYDIAIEIDDGRSADPYYRQALFAERIGDLDLVVRRLRQAYQINPQDDRVVRKLRDMGEVPGPTLGLPPGR